MLVGPLWLPTCVCGSWSCLVICLCFTCCRLGRFTCSLGFCFTSRSTSRLCLCLRLLCAIPVIRLLCTLTKSSFDLSAGTFALYVNFHELILITHMQHAVSKRPHSFRYSAHLSLSLHKINITIFRSGDTHFFNLLLRRMHKYQLNQTQIMNQQEDHLAESLQ